MTVQFFNVVKYSKENAVNIKRFLFNTRNGNTVSLFIVNDGEHFTFQSISNDAQWFEYVHQHSHRQAWV